MITDNSEQVKTCTKCLIVKSFDDFSKRRRTHKEGLQSRCKDCMKLKSREWNKANPGRIKELQAKWRKANPEKIKVNYAKWAKAHPEKNKTRKLKWRKANPEKQKEMCVKYAQANPEKIKEGHKKWAQANPEIVNESRSKWRKANPEKVKKIFRKASRKRRNNLTDHYVISRISAQSGLSHQEIKNIPDLIELKRKQLKYQRIINQLNQENHETSEFKESICYTM